METFRRCVTYLRNWLLAVLGSPTMHTLTSPLSEVPSMVVLGTPPNSISRMPRFTSSFPAQSNSPFSQKRNAQLYTKLSWLEKVFKGSRSTDRGWWGRGWCTGYGTGSCLGSSRTLSPTPSPSSGSWCSRRSAPPPAAPYRQTTTTGHTLLTERHFIYVQEFKLVGFQHLNCKYFLGFFNPDIISWRESLTLGLVGATLQARKASLYESSLTPRAFSPLTPSES